MKLKDHAVELKIGEKDLENFKIFQMIKSRKIPVPKGSGTRAKDVLEALHTDILGSINPKAADGRLYAIGVVDRFSRYQKVLFLKTRDDAVEIVWHFFADIGKPETLVCNGAGQCNLNGIKQLFIEQGVRLEFPVP